MSRMNAACAIALTLFISTLGFASCALGADEVAVVATPGFSLEPGPQNRARLVEITCSTGGAVIRYTVDGSEPDSTSPLYSGRIPIAETIKAIAFKSGWEQSACAGALYELTYTPYTDFARSSAGGQYTLRAYNGGDEYVAIPPTADSGMPVTALDQTFFKAEGNTVIKRVTVPESVTTIGYSVFSGCSALLSVEIGSNVTALGNGVFGGCTSLTAIELPDGLLSIGNQAFYGCDALESVGIGSKLQSIGVQAFFMCDALEEIDAPDTLQTIGDLAFGHCLALVSVNLGSSLTEFSTGSFQGCVSLASLPYAPNVVTIGESAFENCDSLETIELISVSVLGNSAFEGCDSLSSVVIGYGISNIPYAAFGWCHALTSVRIMPIIPPSLHANAFTGDPSLMPDRTYYVPPARLLDYKAADVWKTFQDDIVADPN